MKTERLRENPTDLSNGEIIHSKIQQEPLAKNLEAIRDAAFAKNPEHFPKKVDNPVEEIDPY
jgi:hypothetical protein